MRPRHDGLEAPAAAIAEAADAAARSRSRRPTRRSGRGSARPAARPRRDRRAPARSAPGQGVAFGTPGPGLDGFRIGHTEATEATPHRGAGRPLGVVRYDEIEAVSLLSGDHERLGRVRRRRTLGPLAAPDEGTARLRETLLAWLAEGGNARRAAERLHAHKNTVLYRLQRAQRLLDRASTRVAATSSSRCGRARRSARASARRG